MDTWRSMMPVSRYAYITSSPRSFFYNVEVNFGNGSQIKEGSIRISKDIYDRLSKGQNVGIHYLSWFPERPSLDGNPSDVPSFVILGIAVLLILYLLFCYLNEKALLINGTIAKGWITLNNLKGVCFVAFDYNGKTYKTQMSSGFYGGSNDTGRGVVLLFDPAKPSKNFVYDPARCWWVPVRSSIYE